MSAPALLGGSRFASAAADGTLRVHEASAGRTPLEIRAHGNFVFAPEKQPSYAYSSGDRAGTERPLKHGDLTAAEDGSMPRSRGRAGGELWWEGTRWVLDNDSSYCMPWCRADRQNLGMPALERVRDLLGAYGADVSELHLMLREDEP